MKWLNKGMLMKSDKIKVFLRLIGIKTGYVQNEWYMASCPLAKFTHKHGTDRNPSFGVSIEDGKSHYHCFSCGNGGSLDDLLMKLVFFYKKKLPDTIRLQDANTFIDEEDSRIVLPDWEENQRKDKIYHWPEYWLEGYYPAWEYEGAVEYLESRLITKSVSDYLDIRYDERQGRVLFPFRDYSSKLIGARGRAMDKEAFLRYSDYKYQGISNIGITWYNESNIDVRKPVVLVEGSFDLARILPVYTNVLACLTASVNMQKLYRVSGFKQLILFFDNDEGGNQLADKMEMNLSSLTRRVFYDENDENDPGLMTYDRIEEILSDMI